MDSYNIKAYLNKDTFIEYSNKSNLNSHFLLKFSNGKFEKQTATNLIERSKSLVNNSQFESIEKNFTKSFKSLISKSLNHGIYLDTKNNINRIFPSNIRRTKKYKYLFSEKVKHSSFTPNDVDDILDLFEKDTKLESYVNFFENIVITFPNLFLFDSIYIPSERNLLHLIESNTLGLLKNNVKIPLHILNIGLEYEKALQTIERLPLSIISQKLHYKREGKSSYIYHDKNEKINLLESASSLQTIVPILLLIEYSKLMKNKYNFNFIIEEPELNLYPKAQYELIKYLVKNCLVGTKNLVLTTHSPFVLASINNLLLAFDKGKTNPLGVSKIVKKESWLNPEDFIAYELKNGKARKITDDKLGQIKENMIDTVSDFFSDEFDKLLDL